MRASTFFALFIALLLGFAAVAAARYFHLFSATPPAAKVEPIKLEYPKVLVAKKNLYKGLAISPADVQVRELRPELRPEEFALVEDYKANPAKYLAPTIEAAALRVPKKSLPAGRILLDDYFEEIGIPEGVPPRLTPNMLAINVAVPKERANGGLIRVGDYVDVLLTTVITGDKNNPSANSRASTYIARELCVVLKRDSLWPMLGSVPENKPLPFTLEANPYRAALIDFAKDKGLITLELTSKHPRPENAKLQARETYKIPGSKEYENEDERVAAVQRGDRSVGDADLERIFGLPALAIPETIRVENLQGNTIKNVTQIVRLANPADRRTIDPDQPRYGYHFGAPPLAAEPAPGTGQSPFTRPLTKSKQ